MSQNKKLRMMVYGVLVCALFNACLRISENGMTSLYRIFSPIIMLFVLRRINNDVRKSIIFIAFVFIYNIIISAVFYSNVSFDTIIFVIYVLFIYFIVRYLKDSDEFFDRNFWNFLHGITVMTLILCWLQFLIRIPYPYLKLAAKPGVNVFMSNENEIAEPLGCMLVLYAYRAWFCKHKKDWFWIVNIMFLLFINDAKLTMIGVFIALVCFGLFKIHTSNVFKKHLKWSAFLIITLTVVLFGIVIVFWVNPVLPFRNYQISIRELLFDSMIHIISLEPLPGVGGSLIDRTNAIVYGLQELIRTRLWGIGIGNSVRMLEQPQYTLLTAKSMHNIAMQFLVELGYVAIWTYYKIICWLIKKFKTVNGKRIGILQIVFSISVIFISSQSSIGILSNYYFWMILFYVALMSENCFEGLVKIR